MPILLNHHTDSEARELATAILSCNFIIYIYMSRGALGSVVVKALRYCRTVPGTITGGVTGYFSAATEGTMCPGVDSASENEYQGFFLR